LRRNCLLKQVIEGKIKGEMEVTRRRGRRRKKLLNDLKDRGGYSHLKKEALDRTILIKSGLVYLKLLQIFLSRLYQCLIFFFREVAPDV
jgi:hypothetical protein